MDVKGINERVVIVIIVVAMLMNATWCVNGENSSLKNAVRTGGGLMERDRIFMECAKERCMPKLNNLHKCFLACQYYLTKPIEYQVSRHIGSGLPNLKSPSSEKSG
ncbi:hypothetical protein EUTSA_v10027493mg [Eutrema salsugineum]|uniref:Uncharacterized protein n=1 Tax=Eutrema salsugineum TaxID=72664 RepID=V4MIQ6_EUTSA|nr:hypothetical protein EUTSA_v10027493mg [Eutrema salsugineum]